MVTPGATSILRTPWRVFVLGMAVSFVARFVSADVLGYRVCEFLVIGLGPALIGYAVAAARPRATAPGRCVSATALVGVYLAGALVLHIDTAIAVLIAFPFVAPLIGTLIYVGVAAASAIAVALATPLVLPREGNGGHGEAGLPHVPSPATDAPSPATPPPPCEPS